MNGSEKQIKWANDIRAKRLPLYESFINWANLQTAESANDYYSSEDWTQAKIDEAVVAATAISKNTDAKFWIDNRTNFGAGNKILSALYFQFVQAHGAVQVKSNGKMDLDLVEWGKSLANAAENTQTTKQRITADDIKELANSTKKIPVMVRWHDTNEIEIVAGVGFHDNSGWSETGRANDTIANQDDIFDALEIPIYKLTDENCEKIAQKLNRNQ